MSTFLDQYDPLDIIGNGSFGIIRKVKRKADGQIFARKELYFDRMNERDRKQIVAEVNILKDLHHEHIVRYHDRYVDREAGILYILMEYCGGGDLSSVIKQAAKTNRPIPEDTIWHYFMQILLALQHCHHPGHSRASGEEGKRPQILHRDLKPDNVFLDESGNVKLGDFGLSKALSQASFANTYVGTPYYMSPELMQEKAYDSKSDIWSLGCLIYELCALKPPFHEAKTHSELSIFIRNGRIPPLPRGYSQALSAVIKNMLSLNPAMRPSAAQLLQHERLELVYKVSEAEKMLTTVKAHRATINNKEREVHLREQALLEKEQRIAAVLSQKDAVLAQKETEFNALQVHAATLQSQILAAQAGVETAIKVAVSRREEELRILVSKREAEVAAAIAKREEEIMESVRRREAEMLEVFTKREAELKKEVDESVRIVLEREAWIRKREEELRGWESALEKERREVEVMIRDFEESSRGKSKPLEEVQNVPAPSQRNASPTRRTKVQFLQPTPKPAANPFPPLETPITRPNFGDCMSAMKGVVLTSTGETLETPSPAEVKRLFEASPKVGLNFARIFDFEEGESRVEQQPIVPASPSDRKVKERARRSFRRAKTFASGEGAEEESEDVDATSSNSSSNSNSNSTSTEKAAKEPVQTGSFKPTRLRKPSIRGLTRTKSAPLPKAAESEVEVEDGIEAGVETEAEKEKEVGKRTRVTRSSVKGKAASSSVKESKAKPLAHPHLHATSGAAKSVTFPVTSKAPVYDVDDEENLPSPFLKKADRGAVFPGSYAGTTSSSAAKGVASAGKAPASASESGSTAGAGAGATSKTKKRTSLSMGNTLRAMAAVNNAKRVSDAHQGEVQESISTKAARPALASARRANEEARKALSRS